MLIYLISVITARQPHTSPAYPIGATQPPGAMGVRAESNKTCFNCRGDAYHLQWECEPRAIKLVLIAKAMPTMCKVSEKKCSFCLKTKLFRL